MRILFASTDGQGHLRPLLPFLAASQAAGHEVALLASPEVAVDGVPLLALPKPGDDEERGRLAQQAGTLPPVEADRLVVTHIFGRLNTTATLPAAVQHVQDWRPDLVVHESACAAARLAAEHAGVPTVSVHPSLPSLTHFLAFLSDGVSDLRGGLGLPPDHDQMSSGAHATFFPASMEIPAADLPDLRRFRVDTDRSSRTGGAYVTLGTMARYMPFFSDVIHAAMAGTTGAGLATTVATGGEVDLGEIPDGAEVHTWVDQAELLRTARVIVCHGGSGTVLDALAAAVPLVVVPLFADQFPNAERVGALGVGVRVDPGPDLAQRITNAVAAALEIDASVADEMAALPHVSTAVPWFEEVASGQPGGQGA